MSKFMPILCAVALVLSLGVLSMGAPHVAKAQSSSTPPVTADVLGGWQLPDGRRVAGLRLSLAPGWKTYWRAPGDAGIPPVFDWSGTRNVATIEVSWPTPIVFVDNGMRSVGYSGQVVLPLHITPKRADRPVRVRSEVSIGVCSDICVPYTLDLDTTLAPPAPSPTPAIVAALADMPYSAQEAGVRRATCRITPSEQGMSIEARVTLPHTGGTEATVIEAGDPSIWVSEPRTTRSGPELVAVAEMMHHGGTAFAVNRSDIRITILGEEIAVDVQGCSKR